MMPDVKLPPYLVGGVHKSKALFENRGWPVEDLRLPDYWAKIRGKVPRRVRVAVLDTGVDRTHRESGDLKGVVADAVGFTPGRAWHDGHGHASHCCGIIAANDDGQGMAGVAAGFVELYTAKVLTDDGNGMYPWITSGILWAIQKGADVISMSLGGPVGDAGLEHAVKSAAARGIYVVAAAGNEGQSGVGYPGSYDSCIAVGAVTRDKEIADFSSRGQAVDVSHYGVGIFSLWTGGKYATISGTSMATPGVAGLCALRRAYDLAYGRKLLTGAEFLGRLAAYCEDLGSPGNDPDYGYGMLLPEKLLAPDSPPAPIDPPTAPSPPPGTWKRVKGTNLLVDPAFLE